MPRIHTDRTGEARMSSQRHGFLTSVMRACMTMNMTHSARTATRHLPRRFSGPAAE
jgi:hypothetical protein